MLSKIEEKKQEKILCWIFRLFRFQYEDLFVSSGGKCRFFLSFEYTLKFIFMILSRFFFTSGWMNSLLFFGGNFQVVSSRSNLTALNDSTKPGNSDKRKISDKLYQFFIFPRDWLNSEQMIRLLCCESSGKSYHFLYGKKKFFYFWIDPYLCGRIFHSSLLHWKLFFSSRLSSFLALHF